MLTKKLKGCFSAILATVMVLSVWGFFGLGTAKAAVDSFAPFYNDPYHPDCSTVTKNNDGSITIAQTEGGGGVRTFYGEYTSGGKEEAYGIDLTDAVITLSVDAVGSGTSIELYFADFVATNTCYPMSSYGQGFSIRLADDTNNTANSSFNPVVWCFDRGGTNSFFTTGNNYLVYDNSSPRTSYIGKELKIRTSVSEGNLNISVAFSRDQVNENTAYDFSAQVPLSNLPGSPFDYTNAVFGITSNGSTGVTITIKDITDANSNNYYNKFGGKYKNSVAFVKKYIEAVNAFNVDAATADTVRAYYCAKQNFAGVDSSSLRKNDKAEYDTAVALATEGFDTAAIAIADEVFNGLDGDEITDIDGAIGAYVFYKTNESSLSEYATVAENIRTVLSKEDLGQLSVSSAISDFLDKYTGDGVKRENYVTALSEYNEVLAAYNSLSAFVRQFVGNYAELTDWYSTEKVQMENLYYVTTGTYFTTNHTLTDEDPVQIISGKGGAVRNKDGSTSLVLADDVSLRMIYGTDMTDGTWTDYAVDITDFTMTFSIDSVPSDGRFVINFASSRSALPHGNETNPGLSVFFRMSGTSSASIAFKETAGDKKPDFITDTWATIGNLTHTDGIIGKSITVKLEKTTEGVKLSLYVEGGSSVSSDISDDYLDGLFADIDTSKLVLNFTVGEGLNSYSKGQDILLTVKSVLDAYSKDLATLATEFESYKSLVSTLSVKEVITYNEISAFNSQAAKVDGLLKKLRSYEETEYAEKMKSIDDSDITAINTLVASYMQNAISAIPNVTVNNYGTVSAKLSALESEWATFTSEQKGLYAGFSAKVDEIKSDVNGMTSAKAVIDAVTVLVEKQMLPSNVDSLRAEYDNITASYNALGAKYKGAVSNYSEFTAYGEILYAYNPVQSVIDAINALSVDYATISAINRLSAKEAVDNVKDAYAELTETQKSGVTNYGDIATFEAKIAEFEQELIDKNAAAGFDTMAEETINGYQTITAENKSAAELAVQTLNAAYEGLTGTQKTFVQNYGMIAALQAKIDAYKADILAQEQAAAVIEKINAIGTVENTADCKAKIDAARTAYDALGDSSKAKVTNLNVLEQAEADYETMQSSGCGGSVNAMNIFTVLIALAAAAVIVSVRKKVR